MIELRMLGAIELRDSGGQEARGVLSQPKRLALLAYLALQQPRGFSRRDSIVATFWPELDDTHARGALSQALRFLRRELGEELIERRGDEEIALAPNVLSCDALGFERACGSGDFAGALAITRGPLLAGFFIADAPEFERWLDGERSRLSRAYGQALEAEAERCALRGELREAADCWRRRAECEPFHAVVAQKYMHALAATGDRAGAVAFAALYEQRLAAELEAQPDPGVIALAERFRAGKGAESPGRALPNELYEPARLDRAPGAPAARPEPIRRGRRVLVPALALTLLTATMAVRFWPASGTQRVAVSVFGVQARDSTLASLGATAATWISEGLQQTGLVDVVPSETVLRSSPPADSDPRGGTVQKGLADFARATAATFVVRGQVYEVDDSLRFQAEIVDVRANRLVGAPLPVVVPRRDAMRGVALLRQHVMGSLAAVLDPRLAGWAQASSNPPSFESLSEFVAGLDALLRRGDARAAADHFTRASAADSSYVVPLLWLVDALLRGGTFSRPRADSILAVVERSRARLAPIDRLALDRYTAVLRDDREGAYRASRELAMLAPESHFAQWLATDAYALNRPRETVRLLTRLDRGQQWVRESQEQWAMLAYALHDLGKYARELTVARQARQIAPRDGRYLWLETQALVALGRLDAVAPLLDESVALYPPNEDLGKRPWNAGALMRAVALELRAHGHAAMAREVLLRGHAWYAARPDSEQARPVAVFNRLQRLEELERWGDASVLADTLLRSPPSRSWAQATIGQAAARRGDSATARTQLEILIRPEVGYERVGELDAGRLHLASRIAARLGDHDRAIDLLRQSVAHGHRHIFYDHLTPSFESLRLDSRYRKLMRPRG